MRMGMNVATARNVHLFIDHRVWSNHHPGSQLSTGMNDCRGVNLGAVPLSCQLHLSLPVCFQWQPSTQPQQQARLQHTPRLAF